MKVSDLISRLSELHRRHGDIDVYCCGANFKDPVGIEIATHIDLTRVPIVVADDLRAAGSWIPTGRVILIGGKY